MTMRRSFNALLLAEDEAGLALDRKVLRGLGVTQVQFFSSGRKALDFLQTSVCAVEMARAANGFDAPLAVNMLVCNERLEDMTGLRFLSFVRSMQGISGIPALFLVSNDKSTVAMAARATNSCAVLARPYTADQANAALTAATLPEARHAPLVLPPSAVDRFGPRFNAASEGGPARREPIIRHNRQSERENPGEKALREGLAALQRDDAAAAGTLLHASYQADPGRAETCLALSKLYGSMHKTKEELMWLCRAGVLCLKRGDKSRAGSILGRLPRGREGQAPLLAEASLALQEGEARAAALAFMEAHRLDPSRPLHALIGRICLFTPAPEEHMRELCRALSNTGHEATADKLRWRLLQTPREEEEARPGFLENFPLLYDILSVAAHTFKAWRHAA